MKMKIGIIGYGELGSRLGKRLMQNGYTIYAFDVCESKMQKMPHDKVNPLSTPANVAEKCEVIITCVNDDLAVEQCILGEDGVIHGVKKDTTVIEMTTSTPEMTKNMGRELHKKGVNIIDAPVSRGIPAAEQGTLSILVGGEKETLKNSRSILETLGTDIIHCGELGTGHAVKAINMMMMSCNLLTATETLSLGLKEGLELEKMLDVINVSSGESYMTSHHFPKYVLTETYQSKFSFGLMNKDLKIAIKMAEELEVVSLMGKRSSHLYDLLSSRLPAEEDNMHTVKEIQAWMGGV
ncbi:NAD(P)-dependent oxidoreductase [Salibacterium aidingense]|uniref:NAD(P)-dependent oxidoreductase n=1 Tax=Salibacterium aidingense TaxID=384933 RepID=UPI0004101A82|nr:NAD(P)-dependent oxidoreductase [Salibacterium aidingense]